MITSANKGLALAAAKCRDQADTIDALVAALERLVKTNPQPTPKDYEAGRAAMRLARSAQ